MSNYFIELNQLQAETQKKQNLTYISWSKAWELVKQKHPDSTYTIYENQDGHAFFESYFGIDVKVGVTINGIEHIIRLPVMDGANKAMKREAYEYTTKYGKKTCEGASQFDINKAIMRALTKAIAMHGIGLYVYNGEDLPDQLPEFGEDNFQKIQELVKKPTLKEVKEKYEVSKEWEKKLKTLLK